MDEFKPSSGLPLKSNKWNMLEAPGCGESVKMALEK